MAYERKFKTDAELAAFRSQMAKQRKIRRGGRPKGSTNKNPSAKVPSRTLTVRQPDYEVFVRCAFAANVPQIEFLHMVAEGLKAKNPQLFAVEQKPVKV